MHGDTTLSYRLKGFEKNYLLFGVGVFVIRLLLSLMSRHQLQPQQFSEAQSLIGFFAGLMHLRPAREKEKEKLLFCISPHNDTPPLALQGSDLHDHSDSKIYLVLDTRSLGDYLSRVVRDSKGVVSHDGHPLHRETAEILYQTWCRPHARSENRISGGGIVKLSLGFSNTHRMILSLAQTETINGDPGDDVTYIDYASPNVTNPIWQNTSLECTTHTSEAHLMNHSTNGVCLQFKPKAFGTIRHGDVLGIQTKGSRSWDLARVCWLKSEEEEQIVLGAEKVITGVVSIELSVRKNKNQRSDPLPALLGINKDNSLVVVMPYIPGAKEKHYEMSYMGHYIPIEFEKPYISTPSFHAFNIEESEIIHRLQERESNQEDEDVEYTMEPVESDSYISGYVEEDEYADIWNKL